MENPRSILKIPLYLYHIIFLLFIDSEDRRSIIVAFSLSLSLSACIKERGKGNAQ